MNWTSPNADVRAEPLIPGPVCRHPPEWLVVQGVVSIPRIAVGDCVCGRSSSRLTVRTRLETSCDAVSDRTGTQLDYAVPGRFLGQGLQGQIKSLTHAHQSFDVMHANRQRERERFVDALGSALLAQADGTAPIVRFTASAMRAGCCGRLSAPCTKKRREAGPMSSFQHSRLRVRRACHLNATSAAALSTSWSSSLGACRMARS
jgi:hypothetical protein